MEKMLSTYLSYVSIAGVIAAAGLLTLNATSHACETENAPRDIQLPIRGTPLRVWDFRYMSDFAGDARRELEDAAFLFRLLIVIVVGTLISFFLIEGLFDLMEFLGEDSRVFSVEFCGRDRLHKFACDLSHLARAGGAWWNSFAPKRVHDMLSIVTITFGSLLIYQLTIAVYHVVHARLKFRLNKPT